jgi:prepilin-type N-terminal cleavage/methylation domain-containing protein
MLLGGVNPAHSKGFTLAEVLITLGIIGVVAALTISIISKKVSHIILEKQFKKAYSEVTQAIRIAKQELDVDDFGAYCEYYDGSYPNERECLKAFGKAFSIDLTKQKVLYRNSTDISTFNSANNPTDSSITFCIGNITKPYILSNGMYLGYTNSCAYFNISVDINGSAKPNRLGYDIFLFRISSSSKDNLIGSTPKEVSEEQLESYKQKLEAENNKYKDYYYANYGSPCNYTSNQKLNGVGCSYYAIRNECPDGSGKGYFECLK